MDSDDYVAGCRKTMKELWDDSRKRQPSMLGLINSPGASLIGESLDFEGEAPPTAIVESPPPSVTFSEGYQLGVLTVLDTFCPERKLEKPMSVNLLGISIGDLGWEDSIDDLRRLLALCGIEMLSTPGAGWDLKSIRDSANATLNVMVHDERCRNVARWYQQEAGIPWVGSPSGAPLGFEPLEDWLIMICEQLDADPHPALELIAKYRKRAHREIKRMDQYRGLPRGCSFAVEGIPSLVWPILRTMYSYLGMVPVAVSLTDKGNCTNAVESYLEEIGCGDAAVSVIDCECDLVIADGNTVVNLMARGLCGCGVESSPPSLLDVTIRETPLLGLGGTLRLLDCSLQGLR